MRLEMGGQAVVSADGGRIQDGYRNLELRNNMRFMSTTNIVRYGWLVLLTGMSWSAADGQNIGKSKDVIEVEVLTVTRFGFEPAQIIRSKGKFAFSLENRSGEDVDLHLDRGIAKNATNRVKAVTLRKSRPNDVSFYDLEPGSYVLTDDNHPTWKCTVVIKP